MKTVIVGTNGWPFLIKYWIDRFKDWDSEVDRVIFALSKWIEPKVADYVRGLINSNPKLQLLETNEKWPKSIEVAANSLKEDLLFMHDDTFVYKPGLVRHYFNLAQKGFVVTPLYCNYSPVDETRQRLLNQFPSQLPWRVNDLEEYSFLAFFTFISQANYSKTSKSHHLIQTKDWNGDSGFSLALEILDKKIPVHPISQDGWKHVQGLVYNINHIYTGHPVPERYYSWFRLLIDNQDFPEIADYYQTTKEALWKLPTI